MPAVSKKRTASHNKPGSGTVAIPGRQVPCEQCPLRRMEVLRDFTNEELDFVRTFKSGELNIESGSNILLQGTNSAYLYTVLVGWAFRYKSLADGRRQILNFAVPADFLGLQGTVADEMQHSVEALTDMTLCIFPRDKLWELYTKFPALAYDVTWLAAREEQILDESLLSIGRRTAIERMAYLFLHLFVRAQEVGLTRGSTIQFPFTQQHVADTLGMSLVHANKTLKKLSATRTMRWKGRTFEILDREGLARIANFEFPGEHKRPFI
jgi:CRP/FNR family transcriptional regulator